MKLKTMICLVVLAGLALGQRVDWPATFQALTSHDRTVSDPVREEMLNKVLPRLIGEDAALMIAEIPAIVTQFNRKKTTYGCKLRACSSAWRVCGLTPRLCCPKRFRAS